MNHVAPGFVLMLSLVGFPNQAYAQARLMVHLRASDDQYLVAVGGGGGAVNARSAQAGPSKTFFPIDRSGGVQNGNTVIRGGDQVALGSNNGMYVAAQGGGGDEVKANQNAIGPWSTLTLEEPGGVLSPPPPEPQPQAAEMCGQNATGSQGFPKDNRPPGQSPTGLTGSALGPTEITLKWNPVRGAVGYYVMRDNQPLTLTPITATTCTDLGRSPETTYSFSVAAVYASAQQGKNSPGWTKPLIVLTPPALPPADFKVARTRPNTISLSWSPRRNALAYVLYRNNAVLARLVSTEYVDPLGLEAGSFSYQIAAVYEVEGNREVSSDKSSPISVSFRAFNIVAIGDSIVWGQGLRDQSKFSTKVKEWLESQLNGRPVNLYTSAHSGAVIVPPQDASEENTATPGEVPNSYPSITFEAMGAARWTGSGEDIDLILMDGCINDAHVTNIITFDPTVSDLGLDKWGIAAAILDPATILAPATKWVRTLADRYCRNAMKDMLTETFQQNLFPNAKIVITGYPLIASEQSDIALLIDFVKIRILPPIPLDPVGAAVRTKLAAQSFAWYDESNNDLGAVAGQVNSEHGANRVRFASIPFGPSNAYGAGPNTWLWLTGQHDEVWDQRQQLCSSTPDELGTGGDLLCSVASMGHPNALGAQAYANAIIGQLQSFVPEWQSQWASSTIIPPPPVHAPLYLDVKYDQRTAQQVRMTVFAADWITGAGVTCQVKLNGTIRGLVGQPITVALQPGLAGSQRNPWYGGLVPPAGSVGGNGCPETAFKIQPPILKLKVTVIPGPMVPQPGGVNMRTATVNAVDAQTGQKENGEVYINSKDVGPTGKQIRYSCPAPLLPKLDQDSEPGVQQPGIGPTRKIVRPNVKPVIPPCNGLVELTGYEDAPFDLSRLMQP